MNTVFSKIANQSSYPFILPELPYSKNALKPHLSQEAFEYHHEKHHQAYVTNLNNLIKDTELSNLNLEEIIIKSHKDDLKGIFNNAAQIWNHTFYWHSMSQHGGGIASADILHAIESDFGSFENFLDSFKKSANHFGSAWVWLIVDKQKKLQIRSTGNAETPITNGDFPLFTCDIWEHAYYIDFKNRRADYVSVFLNNLVNWEFANQNYKIAKIL